MTAEPKRHPLLFPLVLGALGFVTVWLLFPRFDQTARWRYQLSRETATQRARSLAASLPDKIDVTGWQVFLTTERQRAADFYRWKNSTRAVDLPALSPILTHVMFVEPAGNPVSRRLEFVLAADGSPVSYTRRDDAATVASETPPDPAAPQKAAAYLRAFGPPDAEHYQLVSQTLEEKGKGERFTWERVVGETDQFKLKATALIQNGVVRELKISPVFAPALLNEFRNRPISTLRDPLAFLLSLVTAFVVFLLLFLSAVRREIKFRSTLILFGVTIIVGLIARLAEGALDSARIEQAAITNPYGTIAIVTVELLLVLVLFATTLAFLWISGLWLARRQSVEKYLTFLGLLKGKIRSREVATAVAAGILLGGLIAALPLAVAGIIRGMMPPQVNTDLFVAPAPPAAAFLVGPALNSFALYGFIVPLGALYFRARKSFFGWRVFVVLPIGLIWLVDDALTFREGWPLFLVAGLTIIVADQIFWRRDFLTLLMTFISAEIIVNVLTLINMPAASLRASGWIGLAALAVTAILAAAVSLKGRRLALDDDSEATIIENERVEQRAERERLVAEFGVARRAQERMLPKDFPRVPGFEITAHCHPAREVGGDLYDFVRLPNERLGIVVADVSGKGVPAALYMTLTKGLIASVAENESDPYRILCETNRHLYEVCRRKMFVTMIMGVLEPATGKFTYARAGHNPALWRRAKTGESVWLKAPGMGLGLNRGPIFERSLKVESINVDFGDALVLYSDGLTEAMNDRQEEYGEERLKASVERTDALDARATRQAILEDVETFLAGVHQQDDLTLIVIRVAEP